MVFVQAFEDTDAVTVTVKRNMAKPALFVRQLAHVKDPARTFPQLLESAPGLERVQYLRDFADRPVSMAVLYFQNSNAAQAALAKLHGTVLDGRRISVAYRYNDTVTILSICCVIIHIQRLHLITLFLILMCT